MTIKQCRSCQSENLKDILSLGKQYLSDFITDDVKPAQYPLDLILCQECFLLQLKETTPSSELYTPRYGYRSGINNTIQADLADVVSRALSEVETNDGDAVLDIGANDGTLLANYPTNLTRVACEPIKKLAEMCWEKDHLQVIVNDFFSFDAIAQKINPPHFKIITAISCFYDLDKPNEFVADIVKMLADDGIFIIQQNYLVGMLQQNAFDNIVHEHLEYYSLFSLEKLLNRHGLEVFHVELNDINGGSFRTYIRKTSDKEVGSTVIALREVESLLDLDKSDVYEQFARRVRWLAIDLHKCVEDLVKQGKTVYTYGASTRGNTLLQFANLDNRLVKAAVERNEEKWGKKIAANGIPIISEEQARKEKPDYMLVLPWFFKKEFLKREAEYLKNGGSFIFPLPDLEVINE